MAKEIKKASLLSEAEKQKLLKKAGSKKLLTQATSASGVPASAGYLSRSQTKQDTKTTEKKSGKTTFWLLASLILLIGLILVPKPILLEYQSAGLVTKSIYMPGWLGKPGVILDTNQRAMLVEDENSLYLCFEGQTNEQCAKYQLRQQQGIVAAGLFWYSSL